jgi:Arc/MetJ family transcription regulator
MRDDLDMRTTLDIDDDVLQAAKELAAVHGKTAGQVVSELARRALTPAATHRLRNGVPVLPRRPAGSARPTMRLVNELRDDA